MIIKVIMALLALLNASWMIFDGVHVIKKGKYFGPEKPGPWSKFPQSIGIDPFKIGPVFILIGVCWIFGIAGIFTIASNLKYLILLPAILTLWYIPIGTTISLIYIVLYFYL